MHVWGMGFMFGRDDDRSGNFLDSGTAVIGWSMEDAPDLFAMLREVNLGDVLYLKTFGIRKQEVRVWHIGKVISTLNLVDNGTKYALGMKWVKSFDEPITLSLREQKYTGKNNVYNNTFYREYNPGIIQNILQHIDYPI